MHKSREVLLPSLIEKMSHVMKRLHAKHCSLFQEFHLNRIQAMILFFIGRKMEGVSVKELAVFLNVTPGAVTQMIDTLVRKKFVRRGHDINDRRIQRITVTPSALKKISLMKSQYSSLIRPAFHNLNETEITLFLTLLDKIDTDF